MDDPNIRQMREFLQVFNRVAETCFQHCVNTFIDRETSNDEVNCLDKCVTKYLLVNRRVMDVYVEVQPDFVQRRIDEANKMQEAATAQNTSEQMTEVSAPN